MADDKTSTSLNQKSMTPEQEAVSLNRPQSSSAPSAPQVAVPHVPTEGVPAPVNSVAPSSPASSVSPGAKSSILGGMKPPTQKIGKEKSQANQKRFLFGCLGGFLFIFILFLVLMVLMLSRGGADNPVMQAFGLEPTGIKSFLQGVIGFSFGGMALLFIVLAVVALFRYLNAQKSDKDKRRYNAKMGIFSSISFVFILLIWVFLINYISRIQINYTNVLAEIVVTEPADISALEAPVEVSFSAANVAIALEQNGLQIQNMTWDLEGDGIYETPVNAPQVTRLFNQNGVYKVGLQAQIVGEDVPRVYEKQVVIQTAAFEASPSVGLPPLEVQFDASNIVNTADVESLDWDFDGDARFDITGPNNLRPRYTFEKIGTYEVLLRVVRKNGTVDRYVRDIEVTASDNPLISARVQATPGLKGVLPFQVRFDASNSSSLKGTIVSYEWDLGDGSQLQSGRSVSHIYQQSGFYTVGLAVEDDLGNRASTTLEVEVSNVSSVPEVVITTDPAIALDEERLSGDLPFTVDFDASESLDADGDIVEYEWDFDDDGQVDAEGENATYTFETMGLYEVKLVITDSEGQSSEGVVVVVVDEPAVSALIKATPVEGTAPLVVQFDGSGSATFNGNIVQYEWDFGDNTPKTITSANVSHRYEEVGTYEVQLRVQTSEGESAATTTQVFVREIPLEACFQSSRQTGLAPLTVSFNSKCSLGKLKSFSWNYGDGDISSSASPTHTFESKGTFTVTLEVTDDKNNIDVFQEVITVN